MRNRIIMSSIVAGVLIFTGCGSSSSGKVDDNGSRPDQNGTIDPHPGETAEQVKSRYLRVIKSTNGDLNITNQTISTNLTALAECLYGKDKGLKKDDIIATFGSGVREEDLNATSGIDCGSVVIRTVGGKFTNTMNVLYYSINNPVTDNEQLLAFDYDNAKSHVVNTNVILKKNSVFMYDGEVSGNKVKYKAKKYGFYLDPEQGKETRTGVKHAHGQSISFSYNFYTDNALMKFEASDPTKTSYIFKSSNLPKVLTDAGVTKLGSDYKVHKNIVDIGNSYVVLSAFDSLADSIKGESDNDKKQSKITVRVGDNKVVTGEAVAIEKDTAQKTVSVLVSNASPYTPKDATGVFELMKYDKTLSTGTKIADGEYHFATKSDEDIYLYKTGSKKLFVYENGTSTLSEVSGVELAGAYDYDIHSKGARHGSSSHIIDGGTTLSGRNPHLGTTSDAFVAFHYDLQENVGKAFIFGAFGAYKHAQVFKLNGTSGSKIFDNGDSNDDSLNPANTESIAGHINLVAVHGDKLYTEVGLFDGNTTLGGTCTTRYPAMPPSMWKDEQIGQGCIKVKYGYLDTTVTNAVTDATLLRYDDSNDSLDADVEVTGIPYYVSRRIAPLASGDKLYISTFAGGSKRKGYKYKQYIFDLGETTTTVAKNGRTYFNKTAYGLDGVYDGTVMAWDLASQTIKKADGTLLAETADIHGKPGQSISGLTSGVPLAGIGSIGMLKNNIGNHAFELFAVDVENGGLKAVDFAPFGGWIYE